MALPSKETMAGLDFGSFAGLKIIENALMEPGKMFALPDGTHVCHPDTYRELQRRAESIEDEYVSFSTIDSPVVQRVRVRSVSAAGESSPGNSSLEKARDPNWGTF